MINCCNLGRTLALAVVAFILSVGSLQAQNQPKCDLSKCSPEERAECAKRCNASSSLATLTSFLFDADKAKCQPAQCQKATTTASAKLVATETKIATDYGSDIQATTDELTPKSTKKSCQATCNKVKASL